MTETEQGRSQQARTEKMARLTCLIMALLGVIVTAVPVVFQSEYAAALILVGSGVAVVALAVFLYFSI